MSFFTEQPLWIIFIGLFVCVILGVGWSQKPRKEWLFGIGATIAVVIVLVLLSQSIETDREAIRRTVLEIADAVEENNESKAASYVSSSQPIVRDRILSEMPSYTFDSCNVLGFEGLNFTPEKNPQKATVSFIVWAEVNAPSYGYDGSVRRRVILDFAKENETWKLIDYAHEDPSQEGIFDPQNF